MYLAAKKGPKVDSHPSPPPPSSHSRLLSESLSKPTPSPPRPPLSSPFSYFEASSEPIPSVPLSPSSPPISPVSNDPIPSAPLFEASTYCARREKRHRGVQAAGVVGDPEGELDRHHQRRVEQERRRYRRHPCTHEPPPPTPPRPRCSPSQAADCPVLTLGTPWPSIRYDGGCLSRSRRRPARAGTPDPAALRPEVPARGCAPSRLRESAGESWAGAACAWELQRNRSGPRSNARAQCGGANGGANASPL